MNPKVIFTACLVITTITSCYGRAGSYEQPTGKYQVSKSNFNDGKYRPVKRNEGRYLHMVQPYVHIHDNRELGQYRHIAIPYNGGYGPYSGLLNPYRHDETGNYDKYTVSKAEFAIPEIPLEYGFPDKDPETTSTTTRRPPTTTTTTTTTQRPRLFNYHEEGGWRILRQEEEKKKHKYDFLYLTENGIFGQEKAHLRKNAGTAATGYYEYTGDDGELYKVHYHSDERGFIPKADHIPTPPPVPHAIQRALEYVAKKKETHGKLHTGHYEHNPDPVRLQNMPTIDRPLSVPPLIKYEASPTAPIPTVATKSGIIKSGPLPILSIPKVTSPRPLPIEPQPELPPQALPEALPESDQQDQKNQLPQQDQPPQLPKEEYQTAEREQDQPQQQEENAQQDQQDQQDQTPKEDEPSQKDEQQDQPDQPPQKELDSEQDQVPQQDQSADLAVEEPLPQASEQHNEFEPPYQVPEQLTDEDNFEFATA